MIRFNSILSRIIWLHVLAIAATSIAIPLATYLLLSSTADQFENRTLRDHADTIANYLEPRPDGGWNFELPTDLKTLYAHAYGGFAFAVLDDTGRVLSSSLADGAPILAADPRSSAPVYFKRPKGSSVYYGASVPERRDGRTLWVQVAQDLEHPDVIVDDIVADFLHRVGWITIPILLCLLAFDIVVVRRALRPVLEASQMAEAIEPARLDLRLPTGGLPREVVPLANAVNRALDRLEHGFRAQREFTADAAHELRTPLALLRSHVDTLADRAVARALSADIERMSRVVGQLLDMAELESFASDPKESADIQSICSEVVSHLAPLALSQGKDIALTGETAPVLVKGNAEALAQAVRNLVENAIRHTAPGTAVEVDVGKDGTLSVLDRGPGVPESEREIIFRRFWRRDRGGAGGAGLGLSIVARVVEVHAGSIRVESRARGGAAFFMTLPLAGEA